MLFIFQIEFQFKNKTNKKIKDKKKVPVTSSSSSSFSKEINEFILNSKKKRKKQLTTKYIPDGLPAILVCLECPISHDHATKLRIFLDPFSL